jgi:signal transduction histidine kinase
LLGTLYCGWGTGLFLSAIIILYRLYIGVDIGLYTTILTLFLSMPVYVFFQNVYMKANKYKRILIAFILSFYYCLAGFISVTLMLEFSFEYLKAASIHTVITVAVVLFFVSLNEMIKETLRKNQQLQAEVELHAFKDKLFAVVAHDIRDPLALLVNLTEIIEKDFIDSGSEESRIFREISSQVRDTHLLVENLLEWVGSQRGKINFNPLVWELAPIVHQSVKAMKNRLEMKNMQMTVSVQDGAQVYADKEMVELILRNLMFNAIKYTEMGGHIHIEAVRNADRVTVSVKDSGVGVDREVGKSLFHEVQQGSSPGTKGERGTGLGLYLCGKFVRLNGGDIGYESYPGQGSTFYFTLPSTKASNVRQRTWKEVDAI